MDKRYQIPKRFYDDWKRLDYGHLVRREDNCWGSSAEEIEFANSDTFHMTNCTPQHEEFNRSNKKGIWGNLEDTMQRQSEDPNYGISRLCVFAGPIFDDKKDLVCGDVLVPIAFWKVVVAPGKSGGVKTYVFILRQKDVLERNRPFEEFDPSGYERELTTLAEIEKLTLVRFDAILKDGGA